jgi:subtilisin family serine protease
MTKEEKGVLVYDHIVRHARSTQLEAKAYMEAKGLSYTSYAVANCIATQLTKGELLSLPRWQDLELIQYDNLISVPEVEDQEAEVQSRSDSSEYGIVLIGADKVWDLGHEGAGVVVAGQDTGYEWDLPQIIDKYRGFVGFDEMPDHNYSWHDAIQVPVPATADSLNPCGYAVTAPCDDHSHGTHTMGTMVGTDMSTPNFGVAPAAQWIGCRNMDRGNGVPSTYIDCFEWFLAPTDLTGMAARPDLAPHVINNSWACTASEGCNPDNFSLMQEVVDNLRLAGIVVVASAGNSGPSCHSITTPAAIYEGSFTVGASNARDTIANFSSRGTVRVDSSFRVKPDIVAPGVAVKSMVLDGTYRYWNGTSMAGPHVAGAVALLISAVPELAGNVDEIERLLRVTAVPLAGGLSCGTDSLSTPNATYGHGRLDIFAAVEQALATTTSTTQSEVASPRVYPNPVEDILYIKDLGDRNVAYGIYDMLGNLVLRGLSISDRGLDVSDLSSGCYVLRLQTGAATPFVKI